MSNARTATARKISIPRKRTDRATADESRANLDFQRYDALAKKDLVSKQQRDTAEANWKMALAQKQAAQHKLDQLKSGYRLEEIAAAEARYHQAEATLEKLESGNRPEDIAAARAALAMEEARYRERQVVAPSAATIEVLDVRPGDLIAPNTPVATLLERDQTYVRIYIPETQFGVVQVGQRAEIRVDSFPKETFQGVVEQINQQGVLPRNVQTKGERVHQVFGVKVRIDDPTHRVLAGMAADVKWHRQNNDARRTTRARSRTPGTAIRNSLRSMTSASRSKRGFSVFSAPTAAQTTLIKDAHWLLP
jgi:multidrug resistance efflux pump